MRIGFIFECGPHGADVQVCEHLAKKLDDSVEVVRSITMTNKPQLVQSCGLQAALLLAEGCERVIIVWDLFPAWREKRVRPCRKADCEGIAISLDSAGVDQTLVKLVCVEEELEAWLLADGRALSEVLSRPTRRVTCKHENRPDQVLSPKTRLTKMFYENARRPYVDREDAIKIVRHIPDFTRLRRSPSFCRFALKATNRSL